MAQKVLPECVPGVVQLVSSGADGLMKLWSVRSTECLNTFDGHEDKVPAALLHMHAFCQRSPLPQSLRLPENL